MTSENVIIFNLRQIQYCVLNLSLVQGYFYDTPEFISAFSFELFQMALDNLGNVESLLKSVAVKEGLGDNPEIKIQAGSEVGDGFAGVSNIIEATGNGKVLNLFVKMAPNTEILRKNISVIEDLYKTEINFYEVINPAFQKFQNGKRNVKRPFNSVSKFYATSSEYLNETLILVNLKTRGFVMFDKKKQMNDAHLKFILEHFARFHAVSFAIRNQEPGQYERLRSTLNNPSFSNLMKNVHMDKAFAQYCEQAKTFFDAEKEPEIVNAMSGMTEDFLDILLNDYKYIDSHSVILHADSWCNNMMFKYEDLSDLACPSEMCLIDWQVQRENSPVFDLSYFFYVMASQQAVDSLDDYLKFYHNALSAQLKDLGTDVDNVYPYSVLKAHWKKYAKFGLLMALMLIKVMLSDKEETPQVSDDAESGKGAGEGFFIKIKNEELYKERIRNIIKHFVRNKFL